MTLETSTVQANEVVKAEDWDFGLTAQIKNIGVALASVLESRQSFVIGGKVTPYHGGGLNLSIAPIFGVANSTLNNFLDTSKMEPIPVSPSPGDDRIDIVEAQGVWEDFDQQQRAFMDFETNVQTFQTIATKKRNKVNVRVKAGTPGSVMAPEVSEGWVKLAEIHLPADAVEITENEIKNISADVAGMENLEWTNDKTATYNIGYISDVNQRFRTAHNNDGTHKDNSINIKAMAIGTGTNELNGSIIPSGKAVNVSGQSIGATTSLADTISNVCQKVTDIWDKYLKNGAYQLNGEVAISDVVGTTGLTNAIKVGSAGDGTGYIKVGDKTVLTFTGDSIRASNGYTATNTSDLITKSMLDAVSTTVNKLASDFDDFKRNLNSTTYSNTVLSRFTMGEQMYAATTGNITLSGLQTIDGVSLSAGVKVLVKDQTNQIENGIYMVDANAWRRDTSYLIDTSIKYKLFEIGSGTSNKGKIFFTPLEAFQVDTDIIFFEESIYSIKKLKNKVVMRNQEGLIEDVTDKVEQGNKQPVTSEGVFMNAMPVGSITMYAGAVAPTGWFICDGSEVSRTTYKRLFDVIGITYGAGNSIDTFNLPDMREAVPVGSGENSSYQITDHDVYALGEFKDDQLQDHTHLPNGLTGGRIHDGRRGGDAQTEDGISARNTGKIASGYRKGTTTHGKQIGVNFIIKY